MRASRLRLNPSKTQVMWLGSSQQLVHVDIRDIPVLAVSVPVVESARDLGLGVIIDSQLTLSAHITALSSWVLPAPTITPGRSIDDGGRSKNRSRGVYIQSVGLL